MEVACCSTSLKLYADPSMDAVVMTYRLVEDTGTPPMPSACAQRARNGCKPGTHNAAVCKGERGCLAGLIRLQADQLARAEAHAAGRAAAQEVRAQPPPAHSAVAYRIFVRCYSGSGVQAAKALAKGSRVPNRTARVLSKLRRQPWSRTCCSRGRRGPGGSRQTSCASLGEAEKVTMANTTVVAHLP